MYQCTASIVEKASTVPRIVAYPFVYPVQFVGRTAFGANTLPLIVIAVAKGGRSVVCGALSEERRRSTTAGGAESNRSEAVSRRGVAAQGGSGPARGAGGQCPTCVNRYGHWFSCLGGRVDRVHASMMRPAPHKLYMDVGYLCDAYFPTK